MSTYLCKQNLCTILVLLVSVTASHAQQIYWTDIGIPNINRSSPNGCYSEEIISDITEPYSLVFDSNSGKIYWGESSMIKRANFDGTNIENIISTDVNMPRGMTLDLINQKLYWTNGNFTSVCDQSIYRANLDGSNVESVLSSLCLPWGIAIDGTDGKIYWADSHLGEILSSNLDGTNLQSIVTSITNLSGLTYDPNLKILYWSDHVRIFTSDTSGNNITEILDLNGLISGFASDLALDLDRSEIYVASEFGILRVGKDGTNLKQYSFPGLLEPRNIVFDSVHRGPYGGAFEDCNNNTIPDDCELFHSPNQDCNLNWIPDGCDIANSTSEDANDNFVPDECEDGSCCFNNGSCLVTRTADCTSGIWTVGGTCDPNLCPPPVGACCDSGPGLGGLCSDDVLSADCQGSHQLWTVDTSCTKLVCEEVTGACCDSSSGLGGICTDDVLSTDCQGSHQLWTVNTTCTEIVCEEVTGACCDRLDGFCRNDVLRDDCVGSHSVWTESMQCGVILCDTAMGACCNMRFGTCTTSIIADCTGTNLSWTKGEDCGAQNCPDPFIPTVSQWGLIIMTLLLLIGSKVYFGRREAQQGY